MHQIVSSKKSCAADFENVAHRYERTADFLVIEGPKAGGHLGFSREQLKDVEALDYDQEIKEIIECKKYMKKNFIQRFR